MPFMFRHVLAIVIACCAPLFLEGSAAGNEILRYAGATTLQRDFMLEASHRFAAINPVRFELEGGNSGAGIKALSAGVIDLAGSGRFLTSKEKAAGLVEHLIGWDPLVVVVHATNPVENVSREELQRMLLGTMINWNQLGGRDLPLLQVAAPQGSGIHAAVEEMMLADQHLSPRAIISLVVADADKNVALLPAGFTVTSLSMVDAAQVKILKVDGVMPDTQSISAGNYHLIKPLLLITKAQPKGTVALFVDFAKSPEGQAILAKKFIPLADK